MNHWLLIKESHDFETHLNFMREFIGSLKRISEMRSCGRLEIVSGSES